ncbi:uncharacterized protein LOC121884825 isoform X3 [Scomber scombrus]|uniref:Uncharacterized protein LOC121884825 isoform X3 n=1 Tax=Scomber scombrus TaxID=13677 RepID=A0AAV1NMH2_SCOSC
MYDDSNVPVYQHYYYYHQPEASADYQDPGESLTFEKETTKSESQPPSDSDYSRMNWQAHSAETGYPSIPEPLYIPFHIPYFHFITQQHPHDPSEHLGEEDGGEMMKGEIFLCLTEGCSAAYSDCINSSNNDVQAMKYSNFYTSEFFCLNILWK